MSKPSPYRFLIFPLIVLIIGFGWALSAGRLIAYFGKYLDLPLQEFIRGVNDLAVIVIISLVLAVKMRRQQETLTRAVDEYSRLFESNPNPMWIYDCTTLRFLKVNEAAIIRYGHQRGRFLRMTICDIRPGESQRKLKDFLNAGIDNLSDGGIWKHQNKSGEVFEVAISSQPVVFNNRSCRMVMASDMTEILAKERKLQSAYQKIRQANDTLLKVAWSTSHELRKPLCSVMGLSGLLNEQPLNAESRELIYLLAQSANTLDTILKQNSSKICATEEGIKSA